MVSLYILTSHSSLSISYWWSVFSLTISFLLVIPFFIIQSIPYNPCPSLQFDPHLSSSIHPLHPSKSVSPLKTNPFLIIRWLPHSPSSSLIIPILPYTTLPLNLLSRAITPKLPVYHRPNFKTRHQLIISGPLSQPSGDREWGVDGRGRKRTGGVEFERRVRERRRKIHVKYKRRVREK